MSDHVEDILTSMRRERVEWEARTIERHRLQDQCEDAIVFDLIGAALALTILGSVLAALCL
ncbi:hypothetical protein CcrColossus_gp331 [Caulobacter phage CcrColossus]|uniref:Uncharacterized protein n=1 Tax=Caulobacter phage CcrColossus TaxID=1211640 RepID=K4JST7_9CAUD|nr:hypothetical protein CcrColossus_gp331 [Caulobacter phage CcrColossus]AFU88201.1 hypothetical protein CcrColossus_gp331 [Caulobacter phage CcrColossus]